MHLLAKQSVTRKRARVYFIFISMLATLWLITYMPSLLSFLSSGFPGRRKLTLTDFPSGFSYYESSQYIFIDKNLEYKWKENDNTSELITQRCNILPRGLSVFMYKCCFIKSGSHNTPHFVNCFPLSVYNMLRLFFQVNKSSSATSF